MYTNLRLLSIKLLLLPVRLYKHCTFLLSHTNILYYNIRSSHVYSCILQMEMFELREEIEDTLSDDPSQQQSLLQKLVAMKEGLVATLARSVYIQVHAVMKILMFRFTDICLLCYLYNVLWYKWVCT